ARQTTPAPASPRRGHLAAPHDSTDPVQPLRAPRQSTAPRSSRSSRARSGQGESARATTTARLWQQVPRRERETSPTPPARARGECARRDAGTRASALPPARQTASTARGGQRWRRSPLAVLSQQRFGLLDVFERQPAAVDEMGDDRLNAAVEKAEELVDEAPLRRLTRHDRLEDEGIADLLDPANRL